MLTHVPRCRVCGWRGEDDVCPHCGTVLLKGLALCRRCGKVFDGPLAQCDACGGTVDVPPSPETSAAIERLLHLPGVDEATARRLATRGFHDPADVLRLALPERAVRMGVHRSLARHLALNELPEVTHVRKTVACATCGTVRDVRTPSCPACGATGERGPAPEEVMHRLEEVAGVVYDLAADADFRGMPTELREEILDAFEEAGFPTTETEYAAQFKEWRIRGLETAELERLLREEGSEAFRSHFVRIIRAQVMKRRVGGRFECPLCDVPLAPTVEECGNCGARFR